MKLVSWMSISLVVFGSAATAGAQQPTIPQIPYPNPVNHVIIIDQENRSMDNIFGSNSPSNPYYLPGMDVTTTGKGYTITNGVKTVININSISIPMPSIPRAQGSRVSRRVGLHARQMAYARRPARVPQARAGCSL